MGEGLGGTIDPQRAPAARSSDDTTDKLRIHVIEYCNLNEGGIMAEELPRREYKTGDPQRLYVEVTTELVGREIQNSKPFVNSPPDPDLPLDATPRLIKEARVAINELRLPENRHKPIVADPKGRPWREAARQARADLAGYWNDLKHELGERAGAPGATGADDRYLDTVLDLMEMTERDGQLGRWLDRWRDLQDEAWGWDQIRDAATSVRRGIEFNSAIIEHVMERQGTTVSQVSFRNREDLQLALDSIAAEFVRQADERIAEFLRPEAPPMLTRLDRIRKAVEGPLKAIRSIPSEALRRIDELLAHDPGRVNVAGLTDDERRKRLGLDLGAFQEDLHGWKAHEDRLKSLKGLLDELGSGARQVDTSIDNSCFISAECQRQCAAVKGWLKEIDRLASETIDQVDYNVSRRFNMSDVVIRGQSDRTWRIARGRLNALASIGPEVARHVDHLLSGVVRHDLGGRLDAVKARLDEQINRGGNFSTLKEFYESLKGQFQEIHALTDYVYTDIFNRLTSQGDPDHAPGLVEPLKKARDANLRVALRKWSLQDPEDTYGLAWQVVAQLRAHKVRAGRLLQQHAKLHDYLLSAYDVIGDQVARQLAQADRGDGIDIKAIISGLEVYDPGISGLP